MVKGYYLLKMECLIDLSREVFKHFNTINNREKKIMWKYSLPLLYLGNLPKYHESRIRIITVGKNPSLRESIQKSKHDSLFQFMKLKNSEWNNLDLLSDEDYGEYFLALNSYFEGVSHRKWFDNYEPILEGLDASYYGSYKTWII